jgi:hypothetical protein
MSWADDLLAASVPMRDLTKEEKRRAVQTLGLLVPGEDLETRICSTCKQEKELMGGYHVKGHDDAGPLYNARCKVCCSEIQARNRAANRRKA